CFYSFREEASEKDTQVYWKTDNNTVYQVDGSKSFNFDRVFHSNETTKNVYEEIAVPIIDSAIQGYNGTIFAYGQTASGKTYTMMGSQEYLGVIPRAIHDIFQKIKKVNNLATFLVHAENRHYGITKMNQRSSRSHTIFRMILESREKGEPSSCEGSVKVSHLVSIEEP
ncbi:hypothetical protein Celaphus_00018570, partial [Cervus elaphus hippelaphus]